MIGILLTNLGTPTAPTPSALRRYLAEFLSDRRVIEIPKLLWWPLLHGFILRIRPQRSAMLYQKIWTSEGSPLLVNSQHLANTLQKELSLHLKNPIKVTLGMRYGKPSIAQGLAELRRHNAQKLLILPLYPQYAAATTGSTFDAVTTELKKWRYVPEIRMISQYFNEPGYIGAIAKNIQNYWMQFGQSSYLLFSFHGLPKRCINLGDPYQQQCQTTAKLITDKLNLPQESWSVVFQSRFGKAEWLQPYCDVTLRNLPKQSYKKVTVICPGFAVDCLETLEEIAEQSREIFLQAGGEDFHYIPALNHSSTHVEVLEKLIFKHIQGWS